MVVPETPFLLFWSWYDCPLDLLIIIANACYIENWWHLSVKGKLIFEGDKVICEIKVCNPACFPVIIFASITYFWKEWQINLVLLQRLSDGLRLRNNIIEDPTFNDNLWEGSPPIVKELRNSTEYWCSGFAYSSIILAL